VEAPVTTASADSREALVVEFRGGIASSRMAADIKFGLEALKGVHGVHFLDDAITVSVEREACSSEVIRDTLVMIGVPGCDVSIRTV